MSATASLRSVQSLGEHAGDHSERSQEQKNQKPDADEFDDGAITFPKRGLRFRQRRRSYGGAWGIVA